MLGRCRQCNRPRPAVTAADEPRRITALGELCVEVRNDVRRRKSVVSVGESKRVITRLDRNRVTM